MVIHQGDIFWIDLPEPKGSGPGYRHPHIVVQNDLFNSSKIGTVVVCALTSNIRLADLPGNVSLRKGEANMPKRSVINVTQMMTVSKSDLRDKIGTVCGEKLDAVLEGIDLVLKPKVL